MKIKCDLRVQVPVDVAVEEPRARVVGEESDSYKVGFASADAHDVADDRVDEVVGIVSSAPNHMEGMLLKRHSACELTTGEYV